MFGQQIRWVQMSANFIDLELSRFCSFLYPQVLTLNMSCSTQALPMHYAKGGGAVRTHYGRQMNAEIFGYRNQANGLRSTFCQRIQFSLTT